MELALTIGRNIERQLAKNQLTQTELAKRMHCSGNTIHKFISGTAVPRIKMLFKLAEALDCTIDELVTEREETTIDQNDETVKQIFKTNIKYYLLKNGMMKGDLAKKIGVSAGTLRRYMKGGYNTEKIAYKIANALNCSYGDLFEEKKERSKEKISQKISINLEKLLNSKGITVEELSEMTGLRIRTISDYIRTYKFPSARALSLIAKALDCKTEELLK